jgi:hypothetical protein
MLTLSNLFNSSECHSKFLANDNFEFNQLWKQKNLFKQPYNIAAVGKQEQ